MDECLFGTLSAESQSKHQPRAMVKIQCVYITSTALCQQHLKGNIAHFLNSVKSSQCSQSSGLLYTYKTESVFFQLCLFSSRFVPSYFNSHSWMLDGWIVIIYRIYTLASLGSGKEKQKQSHCFKCSKHSSPIEKAASCLPQKEQLPSSMNSLFALEKQDKNWCNTKNSPEGTLSPTCC